MTTENTICQDIRDLCAALKSLPNIGTNASLKEQLSELIGKKIKEADYPVSIKNPLSKESEHDLVLKKCTEKPEKGVYYLAKTHRNDFFISQYNGRTFVHDDDRFISETIESYYHLPK